MTVTTATTTASKTCECGCGEAVKRSFLPGHDAKLKSELMARVRWGSTTGRREAAMTELLERGWAKFLDAETLGSFRFRARDSKGRYAKQVHAEELTWVESFTDEMGDTHGVATCSDWNNAHGLTCTTCVRLEDVAESAWRASSRMV